MPIREVKLITRRSSASNEGAIMAKFSNPLAPAPHAKRLPDAEVKRRYPRFRWQVMESTFLGYAAFYVVRNNLNAISKDLGSALHYSDFHAR